MTLLEFRKMFVKLSGRYDLVKDPDTYEDDGANFLISAGIRLLDSMFTHSKSYGEVTLELKANQAIYNVSSMLSIEGVQRGSDEGRVSLTHITEEELQEQDPTQTSSTGTPKNYALVTTVRDAILGNRKTALTQLSIKLFPIPDSSINAYVLGRISIPLEEDNDTNFWTLNYPETLISATMYQIERFHRNRQGMADHMTAIQRDLRELDANAIESQMGSLTQMKDSFKFRGEGNVW